MHDVNTHGDPGADSAVMVILSRCEWQLVILEEHS
jgi:hypothetical protein